MPIIKSSYKRPFYLFHYHLETIIPSLFRKVKGVDYQRQRIETPDGDFLDLDWSYTEKKQSRKLVFISHGLEGSSDSQYARGMSRAFNKKGWDALVWNCRACSGEMNRLVHTYHSGATGDIQHVLDAVRELDRYDHIVMIGFSMGGNLTTKYLGEQASQLAGIVKRAVIFSTPFHLSSCSKKLQHWQNYLYSQRFCKTLCEKVAKKAEQHPQDLSTEYLKLISSLKDFDDYYTAPLHGFEDAEDYYQQCSSLYYIDPIAIPTLVINAQNDPFLTKECFPKQKFKDSSNLYFEAPKTGGHCGFAPENKDGLFWSELRALQFAQA